MPSTVRFLFAFVGDARGIGAVGTLADAGVVGVILNLFEEEALADAFFALLPTPLIAAAGAATGAATGAANETENGPVF